MSERLRVDQESDAFNTEQSSAGDTGKPFGVS
jgi:hypothetical protein